MPRSMESASRHRRNDVQGPDRARAAGARHRPQHGLLQIFKVASVNPQWNGDSWLLTGTLGTTATQAVGRVVWTAAIIGFAALAGSVVGWLPAAWFQPLAI